MYGIIKAKRIKSEFYCKGALASVENVCSVYYFKVKWRESEY